LGLSYRYGKGVAKNLVLAHMWLNPAAAQGLHDAALDRDLVEARMTPAQIAEAERMAREWKVTK
jgi:uncharacterized protein